MKKEKYSIFINNFVGLKLFWYEGENNSYFTQWHWTLYDLETAKDVAEHLKTQYPDEVIYIKNFNSGDIIKEY